MALVHNTSYKTKVDDITDAELTSCNIENGALARTTTGLYMGHSNKNVVVYPQTGGVNLGWSRYNDTQYTGAGDSTKVLLSDGVTTTLPNNAGSVVRSHSSIDFYNSTTNKFIGLNENDVYMATVVFQKSAANANQTHIDFALTGADDYDRIKMSMQFYKGNDVAQNTHIMFQYYLDSNALANGLTPTVTAVGGSVKVWDIIFFISRTQNAG